MKKFFSLYFYENIFKYYSFFQSLFLKQTISLDFPVCLNIELTNHCNAACQFCPRQKMNRALGYIDVELFHRLIDEVAQHHLKGQLTLNKDGESLLHPEVAQLIAYAKEKRAAHRLELYTNGILLDRTMSQRLIKAGLDILYVSLDAARPETYSKIKGVPLFDQVVKNIIDFITVKKELGTSTPLLVVKMVLTQDNFHEAEEFRRFWRKRADNVVLASFHTWAGQVEEMGVNKKKIERYPCPVPWYNPVINFDGKVSACCVNIDENELIMGDVKKASLAQIWQSEQFQRLRRAQLAQDFALFPTCRECGFWKILPNLTAFLKKLEQRNEKA